MKRILAFVFLGIQLIYGASYSIRVIEQTPLFLHLKINFDAPSWSNENGSDIARYEKSFFVLDRNKNYVPAIIKFFNLGLSGDQPVKVISAQIKNYTVKHYLFVPDKKIQGKEINSWAQVKYLGLMGKLPVFALSVFPVRVAGNHQAVQYLKSLDIAIGHGGQSFPTGALAKVSKTKINKKLLSAWLLNQKSAFYSVSQQNAIQSVQTGKTDTYQKWQNVLNHEVIYKLKVKEDGIYKVTYQELLEAGFPVRSIDPTHLRMYNKGREVPIYIKGEKDFSFDEGDYLEFWGEKNKKTFYPKYPDLYSDPFSETNVYWLVYDAKRGLRLVEESGGISTGRNQLVISPSAFRDTLHIEKNNVFQRFGRTYSLINRPSYEIDHYFFDNGVTAPGSIGYDFYLPNPADYGADVTVWAMFRGRSYFDALNNPLKGHKVSVKLRGKGNVARLVGLVRPEDGWKDQQMRMITNADSAVKIDQSILNNGTNRLEVDMFQSGVTDIVTLNWFEISYLHLYRADKNFLKFHVDRDFFDGRYVKLGDKIQFNVDGFTKRNVDVYKLGISKIINIDVKSVTDEKTKEFSYGISFQDEIVDPNVQYVALTDEQKKKVLSIEKYRPWKEDQPQVSLLDHSNQANYLIITHDLLSKECEHLKELKEADGFHVEIVTVRDIYDLFNYGIKSPLAIKDFIRYVYEKWNQTTPLEYVVLVGDAASNYYSDKDLVPTLFYETLKFGAAEADYLYSLLEGDDYIPEVIVSRIPAGSVYELKNYLDKVENYPAEPYGEWTNRTLFLAGYDGTKEYLTDKPVFRTQSLRLVNHRLPNGFFAEQINSIKNSNKNPDPHFGNSRDVIDYFDDGLSYVNFVGHGGGAIWADAGLMGIEEADQLNNGYKLPFISSLTCFTGSFANVGRYSLGEKLILSAKKGAIVFLGSSGVGWIYNDYAIEWGLFDYLWNPDLSIGEAVELMKIFYLANPFYYTEEGRFYTFGYGTISHSQVSQYNLFGDPALHIVQPSADLEVSVNKNSVVPQDEVTIKVKNIPQPGKLTLEITDEENYKVFEKQIENVPIQEEIPFTIPDGLSGQILRVKAFATNQSKSAHGFARIAVGRPLVKNIETIPEKPQVFDPINFKVTVGSEESVKSMSIINLMDEKGYQNYAQAIPLQKVNDSLFQSVEPFAGFSTGGKKMFDVKMVTESGKTLTEHWKKLFVLDPRPDLLVVPGSITWQGEQNIQLAFKVKNNSDEKANNFKIACFDEQIKPKQAFDTLTTSLAANEEKTFSVNVPPNLPYISFHQIKIIVDPDSVINEKNELNNILQANLFLNYLVATPETGTSLDGKKHQKVTLQNLWQLEIAQGGLPQKSAYRFNLQKISKIIKNAEQYDLNYLPAQNAPDTVGLTLAFLNSKVENKVQGVINVSLDSASLAGKPKERMAIYRYDESSNSWIALKSDWVGSGTLEAQIHGSGLFAPFYSKDSKKPMLEVTVNGRPLIGGMLVPKQPTVSILLQDANGVDLHHTVDLKIDDAYYIKDGVVVADGVSVPQEARSIKNIQITMNPDLKSGRHVLSIKAADVNGNVAQKDLQFSVAANFDIIVYGNYPNPFKDQTIISYTIESNEPIDDLSIKIYTTSGRLIRSKMLSLDETVPDDNYLEPNYHELIWDGTDDDGNQVANGVYFAIVKGKYRNKTVKRLLKIARLQ